MEHTLNQLYQGMTFLYGGLALGILYEFIAVFRRNCRHRVMESVWDALFSMAATGSTALCFLIATGGSLRLYGFLLLLLGGALSRWAFQSLFHML